ncbi:MAG: hypothetical protein ACYS17_06805 [Planctomycetota bacterium]|jgi:hypothetical protein
MKNEWQIGALQKITQGEAVHAIERTELIEQGLAKFGDNPQESLEATDKGQALLVYASSNDYASKRQ